jgi:hypothetical protein
MSRSGRLIAGLEERFYIPVHAGRHPDRWIALHRLLSSPLRRSGPVVEWSGPPQGRRLRVLCCGRTKRFRWLLSQLFYGLERGPALGRVRTTHPAHFDALRADLVAAEVDPAFASGFRAAGWTIVPEAVRWVGSRADLKALCRGRRGRGLKNDLNRIASLGYTLEEGSTPADWRFFRDEILLPHARQRFADDAWLPSPAFIRAIEQRGRLLFAVREGRRVSGVSFVPTGDKVWVPLIGVHEGSHELLREGAISALYQFLNEWVVRHGVRTIDLGRSKPSGADGVARYKAKWGFRPTPDPLAHLLALRFGPGGSAIRERLSERRVFEQRADGVYAFGTAAGSAPEDAGGAVAIQEPSES